MCGIAGHPGSADAGLDAALAALAFRGPDQEGRQAIADYRLGCRRLAITDREAGQPIVVGEAGARLAIVMNGSIADAAGLRARLTAAGDPPATGNDAELPLHLYRREGLVGLQQLEGQFALAIVDEARGCLVLGRDFFGEKPLFVHESPDGDALPAFASTVRALAQLTSLPRAPLPAPDAARFVRFGWLDLEQACFGMSCRAFPQGMFRAYYRDGSRREVRMGLPADHGVDLGVLVREAVLTRIHGDRRLGLFLSGGVDSSAIAVVLREACHAPLCISVDFEGLPPESRRASMVAGHLGLPHVHTTVGERALDGLPDLVARAGLPLGDPSLLAIVELSRLAVAEGVGIALSGDGGDELFLGYRRQRALGWARLARELLPGFAADGLARAARGSGARARLLRATGPSDYWQLLSVADPRDVERLFGDAGEPPPMRVSAHAAADAREVDVTGYLAWDLCPKLDLGSLTAGLEARSPFLDRRLYAAACARLRAPAETRGKQPLHAILAQALPAGLRGGRKRGLAPPIGDWLRHRPWVRDVLARQNVCERGPVQTWLAALERGDDARAHLLFNLLSLALWAEAA